MGKKKQSETQVAVKWAVRVFVLGTLILLIVLAYSDFQVKSQAQQTLDAWLNKYDEFADGRVMRDNELADLIVGKPTVRDGDSSELQRPKNSAFVQVYEWRGTFRTYSIKVGFSDSPEDSFGGRPIETIEGPGGLSTPD